MNLSCVGVQITINLPNGIYMLQKEGGIKSLADEMESLSCKSIILMACNGYYKDFNVSRK